MGKRALTVFKGFLLAALLASAMGCSILNTADNLTPAITSQPDPEIILGALPAYIVVADAMILSNPEDESSLATGASLYSLYAALLNDEGERGQLASERAITYARAALCARKKGVCELDKVRLDEVSGAMASYGKEDVPALYAMMSAWLVYMQAHSSDPAIQTGLPKIEKLLDRLVELDEDYENGGAHVYLGVLKLLRPPSLGGKPEDGRAHLERAIEISGGKNLSAKVELAKRYARMLYDKELHDRLLKEVLEAPADMGRLSLFNALAKKTARELLSTSEDYF